MEPWGQNIAFMQDYFGKIIESDFQPPWWAKNRHVQTIWPRYFQRRTKVKTQDQRLQLPDGDFIDLAWSEKPTLSKGICVIFHGLEGSVNSHYANDMMLNMQQQGWWVVLMHFRGCSGEDNLLPRAYHSGDTQDALFFLDWLQQQFPDTAKVAIGFSLGANMLLKLLGEHPQQSYLLAGVAISTPFKLIECAQSINHGFSRVYQKYLLTSLKKKLLSKMSKMHFHDKVVLSKQKVQQFKDFFEFDQNVTAPLHGFASALDYYQQCSSIRFLKNIKTPTLILHAKDDPFMSRAVLPLRTEISPAVRLELSENGGHVGFMHGSPWRPKIWFHQRVGRFTDMMIQKLK